MEFRRFLSRGLAYLAGFAAVGVLCFTLLSAYELSVVVSICTFATLGVAWNILVSTGQISLGHAAFFGIVPYGAGILVSRYGLSLSIGIIIGFGFLLVLVLVMWLTTVHLHGIYFALVTLGIAELLGIAGNALGGITGGSSGFSFRLPLPSVAWDCIAALAVLGIAILVHLAIKWSWLDYAFHTLRLYPDAAASIGINVARYKGLALLISALLAGLAGLTYSSHIGYITPTDIFGITYSLDPQVVALVGGLYFVGAPILGAILLGVGTEYLQVWFGDASLLAYGIMLLLIVRFWPIGIIGGLKNAVVWLKRRIGSARWRGGGTSSGVEEEPARAATVP